MKKFFATLLALCMVLGMMTVTALASELTETPVEQGEAVTEAGTETTYVAQIGETKYTDLHEAMVAAKAGETVLLIDDVNLAGTEWEPVSFKGIFDGQNHTISNLTINKPGVSNTGFITSLNGTFNNVTFTNPTVTGGENTGVVAGRAGGGAALAEDITVKGTIKVETTHSGYARAGVIVGGWAYGNYKNITVDGTDAATSYVKHTGGGDGRYVAGIVGHADDVDSYVNCTVKNITISGGWLCGGIAGPGPSDGLASGCSVENVKMNADYSGGMFGWYYGSGTIENSSVKNVEFVGGSANNGAIGGYQIPSEATVTNVTIENVKNADGDELLTYAASIGNDYYATLAAAFAAVNAVEGTGAVTLEIFEGEYAPIANEQLVITRDNVVIQGAGVDKTTIACGEYSCSGQGGIIIDANNVTLKNMTVTSTVNNGNVSAIKVTCLDAIPEGGMTLLTGCTLENLKVSSESGHGINIHGVDGCTVKNVIATSVGKSGISLANAKNVAIFGCNLRGKSVSWGDIGMMYKADDSAYANPCTVTLGSGNTFGLGLIKSESASYVVTLGADTSATIVGPKVVAGDYTLTISNGYTAVKRTTTSGDYYTIDFEWGGTKYSALSQAIAAAQAGDTIQLMPGTFELGSVKFPAILKNVIIKGADNKATIIKDSLLYSSDGNAVTYEGITIDGIVFDNSQIVFTGARTGEVIYKDWTITNCEFKNVVSTANAAVHFNLASDETFENLTFTNNVINGVSGGNYSGLRANYLSGDITITGNDISNVAWNAIQLINANTNKFTVENNVFASSADEGILNLYNVTATTLSITENQFLVAENQPGIAYLTSGDVSGNYWGGAAPANLPEGVTYTSYYTTNTDGTLGGLMKKLTFNANGGKFAENGVTKITNFYSDLPTRPGKENYTFTGWFTAAEGGTQVTEFAAASAGSNLYAQWTPTQYTITYNLDGGSASNPEAYTVESDAIILTNPAKEGYTFAGWTGTDLSEATVDVTIASGSTGNREYIATWTVNQYTVTWSNGDGGSYDKNFNYGETITLPDSTLFTDTMCKTGYTLTGWTTEDGVEIGGTMPAKNVTFTAQYTVNQYTITFMSNGSAYETITQDYGTSVVKPSNPTRSGYTFTGWDKTVPATMPAENVTITAQWSKNVVYVPTTSTETTKNEDGSTTTTVTNNKTGTVTETTENTDGSTTVTETKKDGTSTSTTTGSNTTTGEDGSTTKTDSTVTESVAKDGTTTKTEEKSETTEAADGSTTKTETKAETVTGTDGSVTATETKTEVTENADGTTSTATTETKTETKTEEDGSVVSTETKTETTEKADGTTSTATTETKTTSATTTDETTGATVTETKVETKVESEEKTVTSTATETKTEAADGTTETVKVEETVEQTADTTTTTKTTATTTATEEKTETVAVKEETVTKEDGTTETKTTTTTETALADGTTATATTDESGKTEASVTVSEQAAAAAVETGAAVALPIPAVSTTTESEAAATVTVNTNSTESTKVEIPVAEVSTSTVAVIVNEDGTETVITETKMTDAGLVIDVPDGATVKIVDNSTNFDDVGDKDWEKDAVDFASARGLVNGVGNNQFDLDSSATRAQVVTMLARMSGVDTNPGEGETWYDKAHEWAVANGITYEGNLNAFVSRQSMFTMLWIMNGAPKSDHDISHFTDVDGLTKYTEPAARWAAEIGLLQGYGNGIMDPNGSVTRGQLAQFLMNFVQLT